MGFKDIINEVRSHKKVGKTKSKEVDKLVSQADDIIKKAEAKLDNVYAKYNSFRNMTILQGNKEGYDIEMLKMFLDNIVKAAE
jgi:hypothetical protein